MSEEPKKKTVDDEISELEEQLERSRTASAAGRKSQYAIDLRARLALEEEHGRLAAAEVAVFVPGQPTMALLRMPKGIEYKRYKDQTHRGVVAKDVKAQQNAADLLAKSCWVYPAGDEAKEAMLDAFPGLLTTLQIAASALAEGKSKEEGKG